MKQSDIRFYLEIAKLAAARSKAIRLKVGGVVLDKDSNLVAYAYNGTPRNFSNECEHKEYSQHISTPPTNEFPLVGVDTPPYRLVTNDNVVHCEANLIAHAARRGISINNGTVLLTHSPCEQCASLLYQSGIAVVYFIDRFRTFPQMYKVFRRHMSFYQYDEKEDECRLLLQ